MLSYSDTSDERPYRDPVTLKRRVEWVPTSTATGEVWSPGPLPMTVWVLPAGARPEHAVVVHAPTSTRPDWYRVDYTAPWNFDAPTYGAQIDRLAARNAPALPPKVWNAALGVTSIDQLALTEDVAA